MDLLRQRALRRVRHIFPERQIYIRSDGRVQFFTFSSHMQAVLAGVALAFLGWVAFTSVNVIFKDRILAAKERHFGQMQASYESRIADLQLSYDELNSSLIVAQDRFQTIADSLEAKQQTLAAIIEHKKELQASLGIGPPTGVAALLAQPVKPARIRKSAGVGGLFDAGRTGSSVIPPPAFAPATSIRQNSAVSVPTEKSTTPGISHVPAKATFFGGAVLKLGALFYRKVAADDSNHPVLQQADVQSARIVRLEMRESTLLAEAAQDVSKEASRLSRALNATGINAVALSKRVSSEKGDAGRFPAELSVDVTDDAFGAGIGEAATAMGKLHDVVNALNAIPLISPTEVGSVSSEFGARLDPFNEQLAFHSGIDLSGPKGSDVHATAAGIVVFAGPKGGYGNTVEVDHGYGIRTRYGHLSKILAQVGTPVDKGAILGRLGSTGRSTGPHVHYEVWYDDAAKDPGRFIKAGRDVLKE